jgi:hypothetical protein
MPMILALLYPSYVKKQVARSPLRCAAKPLKPFSPVKRNTLNFVSRAVENAVNLGYLKNHSARKTLTTLHKN